jgi:hypothetical protein
MTTLPRLVPGNGTPISRLSRIVAWTLLLTLSAISAPARTRTPRLHRPLASQEPHFTQTGSMHMRSKRSRIRSNRAEASRAERGSNRSVAHAHESEPARNVRGSRRESDHSSRSSASLHRLHAGKAPAATKTAMAAPPAGIFARGQSHPDGDEKTPVRRAAVAQSGRLHFGPRQAVEAKVESNDPLAAPIERPAALRTIPADADAGANHAEAAQGAAVDPGTHVDGINRALMQPSRQELAEEAVQPMVLPGLYRNGRLVMPAPLKGSRDVLVHQNTMADAEGLERIPNDGELNRLRASHELVDFPESAALHINPELALDRRCAREWTVRFAADIARAYYDRFHQPLQLSSAVRTVQFQLRLQRVNGNAAQVGGDTASPHLTGQAIDFGKSGMSREEIAWMRAYLLPIMQAGNIDVEEEFQQACFHISVYRDYAPGVRRRVGVKMEEARLR